ncbi:delta subunit of the central stalk of mitochondrial F1F0 ATP synthase, atp16 [Aspergillus melleus]|uniref:Delta subunit of the central stalk of mitochondrial F1F0 ATP synthase, atp16 n=1 Tax=Aspergillus melleus TaxID=138277 RepID=A0ACC3AQE8_9EURO|nr:delta subunit of the central stalk of mitochondrial F1F0 ATP synthase, atp16 [Aspergillus melleus]
MGVLANHVPSIEQLKPGLVEVVEEGGASKKFFLSGGFAVVQPDSQLSINAVEGFPLEEFSADNVRSQITEAQKIASGSGSEQDIAEAKIELEVRVLTTDEMDQMWGPGNPGLQTCSSKDNMSPGPFEATPPAPGKPRVDTMEDSLRGLGAVFGSTRSRGRSLKSDSKTMESPVLALRDSANNPITQTPSMDTGSSSLQEEFEALLAKRRNNEVLVEGELAGTENIPLRPLSPRKGSRQHASGVPAKATIKEALQVVQAGHTPHKTEISHVSQVHQVPDAGLHNQAEVDQILQMTKAGEIHLKAKRIQTSQMEKRRQLKDG